jgi:hypothetical protein
VANSGRIGLDRTQVVERFSDFAIIPSIHGMTVYALVGLPALDVDARPSGMMAKSVVASACPRRRRGHFGIIALGI